MTERDREIHLFETTPKAAEIADWAFQNAGLRIFKAGSLPADRIATEPGFDALYLSPSAAQFRNLVPLDGTTHIVPTNAEDRRAGWPRYLMVGPALDPDDRRSYDAELRAWARAVLDALEAPRASEIARLKVPIDCVPRHDLHPDRVAGILYEAERRVPERARLKREIAALARAILTERLDLIDGAREIERKRLELEDDTYEPLQNIRAFAEQAAEYPRLPERRALWAPETLARFDEQILPYIMAERSALIEDLEAIVRDSDFETA